MGKSALALVTTLALLHAAAPVTAQIRNNTGGAPPPAARSTSLEALNRILGYTGWDDDFLYVAVQVNKPNIVGKNTEAFSRPLEDDAVIVSVQADDDRKAVRRTEHTVSIAISAAHGAQLYLGADAAPLYRNVKEPGELLKAIALKFPNDPVEQKRQNDAILSKIFKYEVQQRGIPRRDNSFAPGYTVELAIPWVDLGIKPEAGLHLGFNVVAQSKSAGSPPIQSLSSAVKGASDVENPSLWTEIILSAPAAPATANLLTVPRIPINNRLELNGEVTPGEWIGLSVFEFGELATAHTGGAALETTLAARTRPEFVPRPPRPFVTVASPLQGVRIAPRKTQKVTPLVLATYEYDYQGDPRKAAPAAHVTRADNGSLLAHHPLDGAGAWFSFDRADWHRKQLAEARREGIDVLLPLYRGSSRARQIYADKGLEVLVMALKALRQAGQDYPQIGLFLDTNSLIEALGDRPDLHDPAALDALYAMIRNYYQHIPAEFRCRVPMTAQNGGQPACPVFLSSADAIKDMDASFLNELRGRFAADFAGSDLLVVGVDEFRGKAAGLDGYFANSAAKEGLPFAEGWLKIATVSAGYGASRTFADKTLPTRRDTDAYRTLWTAVIGRSPDWVLLDGWNDYTNGREITPSVEAGFSLADTTLFLTRMFAGSSRQPLRLVSHDLPSALASGVTTTVALRLQNSGMEEWGGAKAALPGVTYRWRGKNGIVATGGTVALNAPVLAGQNVSLSLPVIAGSGKNSPLPAGDYTLEIAVVSADKRVGGATGAMCEIPVRILMDTDIPAWNATVVQSDMPTLLENGGLYEVNATLRNDGSTTWRKSDGVRIGLHFYSVAEAVRGQSFNGIAMADASVEIEKDIAPGQTANVRLVLPVTDPHGAPLPDLETGRSYQVRWEVAPTSGPQVVYVAQGGPLASGVSIAPTRVGLVDFDFGVRFTQDVTPGTLPGGKRLPVRMSLRNVGTQTWRRNQVRVGYHWYFQDGSEYFFENETSPITEDVPPGSQTQEMLTWITAPPVDGLYWLVWDVKFGDTWASTVGGTRVGDIMLHPIQVIGDKLVFTDLSKGFNIDGVSDTDNTASANFDGQGHSFPAALLPPYPDAPVVPAGMWLPTDKIGSDSPRRIGFRWGPKEGKAKNMIACLGQKIELGKSSDLCHLLHLVAASANKETQINLKLIFEEPTGTSEDLYSLTVGPWDHPGESKDEIAVLTPWHNERDGAKPGAVALYHYTIKIRSPRKLIAIQLPLAPDVKIAAITLEK